jgi:hypothetical protein
MCHQVLPGADVIGDQNHWQTWLTDLLSTVQKGVSDIPTDAITNYQPPRQGRLVEIDEQPDG